jgi:ribonucleoside-diphosphate reductase alpha chain
MNKKQIQVIKRDGTREDFDADKINKIVYWATEGLSGVDSNLIAMNANLSLSSEIASKDIHKALIEAADNLFTETNPNYSLVAGRLLVFALRKEVWGGKNPPHLFDFIKRKVEQGIYDPELLEKYSESEINKLNEKLQHDRDLNMSYAAVKQMVEKYLYSNKKTGEVFETPSFAYMLIAMAAHMYEEKNKVSLVKKAYDIYTKKKMSLPSPLMSKLRTRTRSYASCCLIPVKDTLASINAARTWTAEATAKGYGIGLDTGRIRPIYAPIRNGEVLHTGVIPYLKTFESIVIATLQGARGGSATVTFPVWHYEIEDILQLKNNRGTDANRVRRLDYSIGISKLFLQRLLSRGNITLFNPDEVTGLMAAFGTPEFDSLYEQYEQDPNIKMKKAVPAVDVFTLLAEERIETGRIYVIFVDNVNEHSPWQKKVEFSNLCQEILQHIEIPESIHDENGEIGICTLSAINVLECKSDEELEEVCFAAVRQLDNILDMQDYFSVPAKNFATKKRSLGIGITNLAALLAKNGIKYSDKEAIEFVDALMEKIQYFCLKASNALAQERGPAEKFNESKYALGILPIDTYKKTVDEFCSRPLSMDWESLREAIKTHGLRHMTLTAMMPCEASSQIIESTNGLDPIQAKFSVKESKQGFLKQMAPGARIWNYETCFEMPSNENLIKLYAVIQKYCDMSISANHFYSKEKLSVKRVLSDIILSYKAGLKTLYYAKKDDGHKSEGMADSGCAGGACSI